MEIDRVEKLIPKNAVQAADVELVRKHASDDALSKRATSAPRAAGQHSFADPANELAPYIDRSIYPKIKRWVEPPLALLVGLILAPVMLTTAILILITNGRPVLFIQTRTGFRNKPYKLVKFRTMSKAAEANGPRWSSDSDSRVTRLGAILRTMHLDELPQLWNVIRGEMSFVGPRPELPYFDEVISQKVPLFRLRYSVRPGITGWAQICLGYASSIEEARMKLEYDLIYMKRMSVWFDLRIVLGTLSKFLPERDSKLPSEEATAGRPQS